MSGKLLNGIKSNLNSLVCVELKVGESTCFRNDSFVRHGCIMSRWIFNACMDSVMKEVKVGLGKVGVEFLKEGR